MCKSNSFPPISDIKKSQSCCVFWPPGYSMKRALSLQRSLRSRKMPLSHQFLQRQPEGLTLKDLGLTERVEKILREVRTSKKTADLGGSLVFDPNSAKSSKCNTWDKALSMCVHALLSKSGPKVWMPNRLAEPDFPASFLVVRVLFYHEHWFWSLLKNRSSGGRLCSAREGPPKSAQGRCLRASSADGVTRVTASSGWNTDSVTWTSAPRVRLLSPSTD